TARRGLRRRGAPRPQRGRGVRTAARSARRGRDDRRGRPQLTIRPVVPRPYDPGMVAHVTTPTAAELDRLPRWATLVRAPNPGPMTLDGTNTWVLQAPGARESVVVDPGPADEGHLAAVAAHGPVRAILITHGHPDHVEGVSRLVEMLGG